VSSILANQGKKT